MADEKMTFTRAVARMRALQKSCENVKHLDRTMEGKRAEAEQTVDELLCRIESRRRAAVKKNHMWR